MGKRQREGEKDPWREASVGSAMRFLMASFHLCGRRAEHTVQLAVLGIIHLVLDCLGTQIYKLSIGFFWWLNDRCGTICFTFDKTFTGSLPTFHHVHLSVK